MASAGERCGTRGGCRKWSRRKHNNSVVACKERRGKRVHDEIAVSFVLFLFVGIRPNIGVGVRVEAALKERPLSRINRPYLTAKILFAYLVLICMATVSASAQFLQNQEVRVANLPLLTASSAERGISQKARLTPTSPSQR